MKKILNVAHRGLSGLYPENTMIAFRKAIEADCDGIEMDVHLTRDGVPVVIHDEEVDRTTNGSGYVKDFTYEQLCNLDAGIKFSDEFKGEKIPTLKEFFDFMKDNDKLINIELKNSIIHYEGLEEKVYKELFIDNNPIYTKSRDEGPTHYTKNSEVTNSIIANGSYIEGKVENSIIGRRVYVGPEAIIKNCIIMQETVIGENAHLDKIITDKAAVIRDDEKIVGLEYCPMVLSKPNII